MRRLRLSLAALLCSHGALAAPAAPDLFEQARPHFRLFTESDGLPQNTVQAVAFDPRGFVWVGTQEGAAAYDGKTFKRISFPGKGASHYVHAVLAARDGATWFATWGSGLYRLEDNRWTTYNTKNGLPSDEVRSLVESRGARGPILWAGTSKGLARLEDGSWTTFGESAGLPAGTVWSLCEETTDASSRLWIGTDSGLAVLEGSTIKPVAVPGVAGRIWSLLISRPSPTQRQLWVGTEQGLAVHDESGWRLFTEKDGLPDRFVSILLETSGTNGERTLWVGTRRGLASLSGGRFQDFTAGTSLENHDITSLGVDLAAPGRFTLWAGSDAGLGRMVAGGWLHYPRSLEPLGRKLRSILETSDPSGRALWFGAEADLARYSAQAVDHFSTLSSQPVDTATALLQRRDGTLLAGTRHGELLRLVRDRWQPLDLPGAGVNNSVLGLLETDGAAPVLWVARRNGLARNEAGRWQTFDVSSGLPNAWVSSLAALSGGAVWIGTFGGGLARWNRGRLEPFEAAAHLPSQLITTLRATRGGAALWIGTGGAGAALYEPGEAGHDRWTVFSPDSDPPLPDGFIYQIQVDAQERAYLFTNRGVVRLTRGAEGRFAATTFTTEDGLPSNEFTQGASLVDSGGRIWAGTEAGVAVFNPSSEVQDVAPKPLVLEAARSRRGQALSENALLRSDENGVSFEYALLSYFREAENRYRTEMVGVDAEPTAWTADAKREFPSLPAGSFEFRIWARDYAGNVSGPKTVHFSVRPPPWATWWAQCGYGLVVLLALGVAVRLRTRALQRRAEVLELKVVERTKEVEEKNRQLSSAIEEVKEKNQALVESHQQADRIFSALADALSGTTLDGKYKLEEKIGEGGFGAVFRALTADGNKVAVKVFRPQSGNESMEALERFRQEGLSASRVVHKNAVNILDSGVSSDGIAYLAMELLEGRSLAQELKERKKLSPEHSARVAIPVLSALAEAHRAGIIHRDIKPENIFLHQGPTGEVVKVVDFGVAKLQEKGLKNKTLTVTGAVVGTPTYMAPERLENLSYDGRSDVYSVGIVLYEMLLGSPPFDSKDGNLWSIVMMHLTKAPAPPTELDSNIPAPMTAVVLRALAKSPADRPTAQELAELLAQAAGLEPPAPPRLPDPPGKSEHRARVG